MADRADIVISIITAIAPTLAVVVSWWNQRAARRATDAKVEKVHKIVNSQRTAMQKLIKAQAGEIRGLEKRVEDGAPRRKRGRTNG